VGHFYLSPEVADGRLSLSLKVNPLPSDARLSSMPFALRAVIRLRLISHTIRGSFVCVCAIMAAVSILDFSSIVRVYGETDVTHA